MRVGSHLDFYYQMNTDTHVIRFVDEDIRVHFLIHAPDPLEHFAEAYIMTARNRLENLPYDLAPGSQIRAVVGD